MTQGSDQAGAGATATYSSPWPSGADPADTSADAPMSGAAGAMTLGSILTVAGILLLFVVFAFGLVTLQYCFNAWEDTDTDRHHHLTPDPSGRRRRRRGPRAATTSRGVDPDLLRSLPVTVYRAAPGSDGKHDDGAAECAVCLAELEDGEAARFLPRCGHGFHAECVDAWLASHTTCPLCRLTVAKPDDGAPPAAAALPPVPLPPEPATYYAAGANLPASVLLGVSVSARLGAAAMTTTDDAPSSPYTAATSAAVLVVDIPAESLAVPTAPITPRDALKSPGPGSARFRSIKRLWSFGRQAGPSSSCSCAAGAGEEADLEQGITIGSAIAEAPLPGGAARGADS